MGSSVDGTQLRKKKNKISELKDQYKLTKLKGEKEQNIR